MPYNDFIIIIFILEFVVSYLKYFFVGHVFASYYRMYSASTSKFTMTHKGIKLSKAVHASCLANSRAAGSTHTMYDYTGFFFFPDF